MGQGSGFPFSIEPLIPGLFPPPFTPLAYNKPYLFPWSSETSFDPTESNTVFVLLSVISPQLSPETFLPPPIFSSPPPNDAFHATLVAVACFSPNGTVNGRPYPQQIPFSDSHIFLFWSLPSGPPPLPSAPLLRCNHFDLSHPTSLIDSLFSFVKTRRPRPDIKFLPPLTPPWDPP